MKPPTHRQESLARLVEQAPFSLGQRVEGVGGFLRDSLGGHDGLGGRVGHDVCGDRWDGWGGHGGGGVVVVALRLVTVGVSLKR